MNKYVFYGYVIPGGNFWIDPFEVFINEIQTKILLTCRNSKIIAECECFDESINVMTISYGLEVYIRCVLDSIGFSVVSAIDVIIDTAFNVTTRQSFFLTKNVSIFNENDQKLVQKNGYNSNLSIPAMDIATLCLEDVQLRISLGDFREALRQPNLTAAYCHRAIESLKHANIIGKDNSQKLEQLKKILKIRKNTLDRVTIVGNNQRHGKVTNNTAEQRTDFIQITWEIIRRYILLVTKSDRFNELQEF